MLRLGLDLGTNSVGWALFRLSDGDTPEPVELVDGGVLIHADGRNPKDRASNAAKRREKRGPRRNRDRAIQRLHRVANLLHDLALLPEVDDEERRAATRKLDPLQLRSEALDRALTPYELGRVLLSFVSRRGFKSNRRAGSTNEDGVVRRQTKELARRMAQAEVRTLGEYLWRRRTRRRRDKTTRARGRNNLYPAREMIQDELEKISRAQVRHHPHITDEAWNSIIETLLHQRDLRPVKRGHCTLIPTEYRAYKAYPLFQEFRIWQEVLNIEIAAAGEGFRPLAPEDRERVVSELKRYKDRGFDRLFPNADRINLSTTARDKLDGDLTGATLRNRNLFGTRWNEFTIERQQEIVEHLIESEDHDELIEWLQDECGLSEPAAEATASVSLPRGTTHLSKAAIERLLPHMRNGVPYHEAVPTAGLGSHSDMRGSGSAMKLPYYGAVLERHVIGGHPDGRSEVERHGRVANPTVHIALGQVRRLFNAIAEKYGRPHQVVVELARDLKQGAEERERDQERIKENQGRNIRLRELASKADCPNPSGHDMRKLRLWDEQGTPDARVCPFTGETLSVGRVLSEETEIEHILPYSRSLDDSMANTVLSMRSANREKGARTPYEAWGHDPIRYQEIMRRTGTLPRNKQWRFEEDAMERLQKTTGFLDRQLNETRYLSRLVRQYLEQAVNPNHVWVIPGQLTSMLRYAWGLDSLLSNGREKNRDDHRHHLIDAVVVGMTSRSLLQKVATDSARAVDELGERVAKTVTLPWNTFRDDVRAIVLRTIVRHRPDHFTVLADKPERKAKGRDITTGSLHNDTAYGIVEGPDAKGMMTLVETKPLDSINPNRLADIRDRTLQQKLSELWQEVEATGGKEAEKRQTFVRRAREDLGVRRLRVLRRLHQDSLAFIPFGSKHPYKAYETNGNAFMDIWLLPQDRVVGETVSRFHAHQPTFRSTVTCEYPTAKKLMRLHVNDTIAIGTGKERRILRVKNLSRDGRIRAVDHNEGGDLQRRETESEHPHPYSPLVLRPSAVNTKGMRKISVDVLGRVRDRGPIVNVASRG